MKNKEKFQNLFLYSIFAGYIILMLDLLFLGRLIFILRYDLAFPDRSLNLIPFASIIEDIILGNFRLQNNFLGNIFIFIPVGVYLLTLRKDKTLRSNLLIISAISLGVEISQFITRTGVADIDDIILNTLGGLLGMGIYKLIVNYQIKKTAKTAEIAETIETDEGEEIAEIIEMDKIDEIHKKAKGLVTVISAVIGGPVILLFLLLTIYNF